MALHSLVAGVVVIILLLYDVLWAVCSSAVCCGLSASVPSALGCLLQCCLLWAVCFGAVCIAWTGRLDGWRLVSWCILDNPNIMQDALGRHQQMYAAALILGRICCDCFAAVCFVWFCTDQQLVGCMVVYARTYTARPPTSCQSPTS
jgi:hypothetical protein